MARDTYIYFKILYNLTHSHMANYLEDMQCSSDEHSHLFQTFSTNKPSCNTNCKQ